MIQWQNNLQDIVTWWNNWHWPTCLRSILQYNRDNMSVPAHEEQDHTYFYMLCGFFYMYMNCKLFF